MEIKFTPTTNKKEKPDFKNLGFGNFFTDYMFEMNYIEGQGWINPEHKEYAAIPMDPSSMVFHYGQAIFEGLKAYKTEDGGIMLFRPERNMTRLNKSADRICIPAFDEKLALQAIIEHVKLNKDWIPEGDGSSLYLRPFIFATEAGLGVSPSKSYKFLIISSPVGAYYATGFNPVNIYIEDKYVRAIRGGVGEAKTAANYVASIKAQKIAKEKGFTQVLWLDGVEQKYIEEVGTMNVFFKINGTIVTPKINGSILEGITRDSVITILKDMGYDVQERKISVDELASAAEDGSLEEAFGTGTAAVISPVGELYHNGKTFEIGANQVGPVSKKLYDTITGIQTGKLEDKFGWTLRIE